MRILWVAAAVLVMAPSASACSLAYQELWQGDLDGDILATALGHEAVRINLATGAQRSVAQDYFPVLRAESGYIFHAGQEGLGADCSGREYLEVQSAAGTVVHTGAAVDAMDADGALFAVLRDSTIQVRRLGTWNIEATFQYDRGGGGSDPFGASNDLEPALALDASNERVAVTDADGVLHVFSFDGTVLGRFDFNAEQAPVVAWHNDGFVFASGNGAQSTFTIHTQITGGDRYEVSLSDDGYHTPQIASGEPLLLQHGNEVLRVDGTSTQRLRVPSGHTVSAIAADGSAAVIMSTSDEYRENAQGIQQIEAGQFTTWHEPGPAGTWVVATRPSWSWTTGPALEELDGETPDDGGEPPLVEDKTGIPFPAIALVPALLLARRRH